jgi:hypothetical protein
LPKFVFGLLWSISASDSAGLHDPLVSVWLQACSFFELNPRLAASATPPQAKEPAMIAEARPRRVILRSIVFLLRE